MTAIIILNWNGYEMLAACVQSLCRAQGDFFTVVADNGSTDGSAEKLSTMLRGMNMAHRLVDEGAEAGVKAAPREVIIYSLKKNYGFAKGNNKAIALAVQSTPDNLLLLNNDTEVAPDFLVNLCDFHSRHPKYRVLTPLIHYHYDKSKIWNAGGKLFCGFRKYNYAGCTREAVKEAEFLKISFVTGCALFFTTDILAADGTLFTERFFFGEEDFDFSLRMKERGVNMACVLSSVVYHKVSASVKGDALPGKIFIHYLNRFIDIKRHYGRSFYLLWRAFTLLLVKRTIRRQGCPDWLRRRFVTRLLTAADSKDGVTADDFRNALAGGWSGVAGRPLRLFMLADTSSPHTKRWVRSTAERGVDIFLFSFNDKGADFYKNLPNVTLRTFGIFDSLKEQRRNGAWEKLRYLKTISELKRSIREFNPDILHAHYATSYTLLGILSGFRPLLTSMWGSDIYLFPHVSPIHKALLKYNLSKVDRILSTSACMAREASKYTAREITVTPFGIDLGLFAPQPVQRSADELVVGTVKTLEAKYGIDTLIEAFAMLKAHFADKKLTLIIAGDGKDKEGLQALAARLNVAEDVHFTGKIPNNEVPALLSRMDVYVALSHVESFGVAALEAMACEVPVVVSDADGFLEVVADGEVGFIVPKKNVNAAYEKILYLLENREAARAIGRRGREYVAENYSWEASVDKMMSVYRDVLK